MGSGSLGTVLIIGVVLVGGFLVLNKKTGILDIFKNFGGKGAGNFLKTGSITGNQPNVLVNPDEGGVVANSKNSADECKGFKGMGAIYDQCINSKMAYTHSYFAGGRYDGRGIGSRITIG